MGLREWLRRRRLKKAVDQLIPASIEAPLHPMVVEALRGRALGDTMVARYRIEWREVTGEVHPLYAGNSGTDAGETWEACEATNALGEFWFRDAVQGPRGYIDRRPT